MSAKKAIAVAEQPKKTRRCVVLGSQGHGHATCWTWTDKDLPNLVDYDTCVVNVRSLSDNILNDLEHDLLQKLRILLTRLLVSNGQIVVLADIPRSVRRAKKYPEYLDNYDWSPWQPNILMENGETIAIHTNDFASYLAKFKRWRFYFGRISLASEFADYCGPQHENRYEIPHDQLATNRENRSLAVTYSCKQFTQKYKSGYYGGGHYYYNEHPDRVFGKFTCLPLISDLDDHEAVSLILEDLLGAPQTTPPPTWVADIAVPGVAQIVTDIKEQEAAIDAIRDHIDDLTGKQEQLERYRKLLYGTGVELESVFNEVLERLGATVTPAKYAQEEYVVNWRGEEYLVEVKGVNKSIALTHVRQLMDYMIKFQDETGKLCKGILFGNGWRNLPPQERDTSETPTFPDNVKTFAKAHNMSLVRSTVFFSAFAAFLDGKLGGGTVLDAITSAVGEMQPP